MYLYQEDVTKLLKSFRKGFTKEFRSNYDLMKPFLLWDDWSKIIKIHTLVECLVTNLILAKTNEIELKKIIERLPLAEGKIGKLTIIKEYELLSREERGFIRRFSILRNNLVHNSDNISFNLCNYINTMDNNQKNLV